MPGQATVTKDSDGASKPRSFGRLRTYFLAGVLVTAPFAITLYVAWLLIDFVDTRIKPLIPSQYNPDTYLHFGIPGLGVIILIVFLTLVGYLTAGLLGRVFVSTGERLMARMPIVRTVYGATKQIVETVFSHQSNAFREVVLVEYPRKGIWTLGFVVGEPGEPIQSLMDDEAVSIMVPTTPNPTSGFLLFVPRRDVKTIDISVEDGMKMILSVGMVTPTAKPDAAPAALPGAAAPQGPAGQAERSKRIAESRSNK